MEVSREKSRIATNDRNNISANIRMNDQKLEEVSSFKFPGTTLCEDGTYSTELSIRIASKMTAMARLHRI